LRDAKTANTCVFVDGLAEIALWSVVEVGLGIIAGSAATLKPLFRRFFGSTTDSSSYSHDHNSRPYPGSYRLRDISKHGLETTIIGGEENDRSDIGDEDTASQRRILRNIATERQSPERHSQERHNLEGIKVTYDINVSNEDKKENKVEKMI
jgi:hypothetical protein